MPAMIERHVLLKLHPDHATPEGRATIVAEARRILPAVAGVRAVVLSIPADAATAGSWDVALRVTLDDVAALDAYFADPRHQAFVDEVLTPRTVFKKAWNFEPCP